MSEATEHSIVMAYEAMRLALGQPTLRHPPEEVILWLSIMAKARTPDTTEELLGKLVARGLMKAEHNLQIWQHVDGSGFGAAVEDAMKRHLQANEPTLREALEKLLQKATEAKGKGI